MTINDIFTVIWRRKWIIIAVTVLASAIAVSYLQRLTPNFESSTTIRISPLMTEAINTGMLSGIAVDVDPSVISTPTVLEAAEVELKVPSGSLVGSISQEPIETATTTTSTFHVTASAGDPRVSQQRAAAAAAAYSAYLDGVMASTQKALSEQLAEVSGEAKTYQNQVDDDPADQLAQTNLTTALARVNALNASITSLQTAGPPATITAAASAGASTNPTTLTVAGVALASGLLAGLGLALARDRLDTRIRRPDEIERATSSPVLAQLPIDRRATRKSGYLPAEGGESSPMSEGLRSLRTTLQVAMPRESGVLVVTSVEPGDGKTFVSANLAASWARTGRRVVLVAGDLRRPSLDAYFPDSMGGPGLGGLLSASGPADDIALPVRALDALQPTAIDGLRVLPPGALRDDPADALATARMGALLRALSDTADIVIVDTPPALALADASMVAGYADGTIVLASMNRTKQPLLSHVFTTLTANGAAVLGTVANRTRHKLPRSYSAYYLADDERPRMPHGERLDRMDRQSSVRAPRADRSEPRPHERRDRVLVVCTANESRSPFAAAMLRAKTRGSALDIDSAGTEATGRGASQTAALHAAAAGLDLSSHTSTQVDPASLTEYDLILTLTREHARTLLASTSDIAPRLFTVRQFAQWIDGHERPSGVSLGSWLDDESDQSALDFLGDNPEDDIDDPTGRTASRWKTMIALLDEALADIASGLYPSSPSHLPVAAQRTRRS
ncbi:Wzz/FepE/Etk N-terminal domain-containing protein [Paramicrobacterium agarici]|uniref:Capsular exopolysaccharide synthesis family protein n=1 Tax=Paramicrobacterium agarici TaxID=630514 RepID=A0A2A9DV37_9MICO|nr:Wzz/FepE/Etk N-terminal domain-containing protein [Microbacterium agarici]PFG30434.1 capsular exopolysaccharide synthesis family protein [Microbacterium agarici]